LSLTNEQEKAVNLDGKSIIVTAAAGSGKTRVLVERLIRQICDEEHPVSVKNIAIVTFTNEAADNMKSRLLSAIAERLRADPRNVRLRREAALIPTADICTIDSFCLKLTREHIADLPLADGFAVLDPGRADVMFASAMSDVLEEYYKTRKEDTLFLSDIFSGKDRNDKNLREQLKKLYHFLRAKPFYPDFLKNCAARFEGEFDPESDRFYKITKKAACEKLIFAASLAEHIENKAYFEAKPFAAAFFDSEKNALKVAANAAVAPVSPDELYSAVTGIAFETFRPKKEEREFADTHKPLRDEYKAAVKLAAEDVFTLDEIRADRAYNKKAVSLISEVILAVDAAYTALKRDKNAVDYADYIHFALSILCKNENGVTVRTETAKQIALKTEVIMIDEYQDSNDTQDLIFKLISRNPDGADDFTANNNLFTVGDVKQSIYGFRGANPRIFTDTLKNKAENPYLEKISLSSNFRSRPEVIDFVNAVMTPLMTANTFDGLVYAADRLIPGKEFATSEASYRTEIIAAEGEMSEAEAAALRIRQLIDTRFPVCSDNGEEGFRPCEPRDFVILMRSVRNTAALYETALERQGLRFTSDSAEGYLSSYEITLLLNLLRFLDNPLVDIPALSVMMSPMFGFSANETAEIKIFDDDYIKSLTENCPPDSGASPDKEQNDKPRRVPFYNLVLYAAENGSSALREKIAAFIETTSRLRGLAFGMPLPAFLRYIYDTTDLPSAVKARFSRGEQKKANLRLLIKYASDFVGFSWGGISGFIRYIENIKENGGDFEKAKAVSAADNAVRIMSIHKSKGLEFPFVFLCGSASGANTKEENPPLEKHSEYGFALRYQNRDTLKKYVTFPQHALRLINKNELRAERLRLLYVALTRAKERIFITAKHSDLYKAEEILPLLTLPESTRNLVFSANDSLFLWIMSALNLSNIDCFDVVTLGEETAANRAETPMFTAPEGAAEKLAKRLIDSEKTALAAAAQSNRPARLSVTEINALKTPAVYPLRSALPQKNADTPRLSAAERGTATHRFMQFCNFKNAFVNIGTEAERLGAAGLLSEKDIEGLDKYRLKGFFDSDFFNQRLLKSPKIRREIEIYAKISDIPLDESLKIEYNISGGSFLQGVADLVFEEKDGLILLDYKTNRRYNMNEDEFTEHLRELYTLQLTLYAKALEVITGKEILEKYIWAFDIGKIISVI
jgi:ATP-dependent helicase/nuclease subunit A